MAWLPDLNNVHQLSHAYVEWGNSPTEGFDANGHFFAQRTIRCAWDDHLVMMRELKGGVIENLPAPRDNVWYSPAKYPWLPTARVTNIECTPWPLRTEGSDDTIVTAGDAKDRQAKHKYAMLTVHYAMLEQFRWSYTTSGEFTKRPIRKDNDTTPALYWFAANSALNRADAPGVNVIIPKIVLEIPRLEDYPPNAPVLPGSINNDEIVGGYTLSTNHYLPLGHPGYPIGTLRFDGMEYSQARTSATEGEEPWTVKVKFSENEATWNKFYPPGSTTAENLYTHKTEREEANKYLPYPSVSMNSFLNLLINPRPS